MSKRLLSPDSNSRDAELSARITIVEMLANELIGILLVERLSGMKAKASHLEDLSTTMEGLRRQFGLPSAKSPEFYGQQMRAAEKLNATKKGDSP